MSENTTPSDPVPSDPAASGAREVPTEVPTGSPASAPTGAPTGAPTEMPTPSAAAAPQDAAQWPPNGPTTGHLPPALGHLGSTPIPSAWAPFAPPGHQQHGSFPPPGGTPQFGGQPPLGSTQPPLASAQPAGAPAATTTRQRSHTGARATLIGVAVAALAVTSGIGGGLIGASLSDSSTATSSDSSLSPHATSQTASDRAGSADNGGNLGSVQDVAAKVLPSVVSVVAMGAQSESEGSGVVLTASGLILTNNHVIDGATTLTVQFNDGTTAAATVVGADPTDDLAVLKASGVSGLTPAALGSSADVQVGQQVVAIGSPLGLSATVTTGIVSALNRPVRTEQAASEQSQGTVLNAIQTDAAINPGNSGGPLVDMDGRVIGINSAIASLSQSMDGQAGSIGVGFAIPIDQAYRIAQEIIDTGTASHAVLGATVTDAVDRQRGITTGAQIASVTDGGGAAAAGLKAGDVVTKVGSVPIESADALVATIRSSEPGSKVQVTYVRDGAPHTIAVTLGSSSK